MTNPPCPNCGRELERRESMFFWRGQYEAGWVCSTENALWAIRGEEIPPLRGTGLADTRSDKP